MSDKPVLIMMRSSLLSEPEGPFAQHDGQIIAPVCDENGNQWVSLRVGNGSGSGVTTTLEAGFDQLDGQPNFSQVGIDANGLAVVNHPFLFDGDTKWDRWSGATSTTIARGTDPAGVANGVLGAALVTNPGNWAFHHTPAANTKATITVPSTGLLKIVTAVSFGFNAVAAEAGTFIVNLINGGSGGGSILNSWRVGPFAAGASAAIEMAGLNILVFTGHQVTLEFAAAPGNAANFEWVNVNGFDVVNSAG